MRRCSTLEAKGHAVIAVVCRYAAQVENLNELRHRCGSGGAWRPGEKLTLCEGAPRETASRGLCAAAAGIALIGDTEQTQRANAPIESRCGHSGAVDIWTPHAPGVSDFLVLVLEDQLGGQSGAGKLGARSATFARRPWARRAPWPMIASSLDPWPQPRAACVARGARPQRTPVACVPAALVRAKTRLQRLDYLMGVPGARRQRPWRSYAGGKPLAAPVCC